MTGKVFANILRLTFRYPWTKSLGKSSVNLLTWAKGYLHSAARGTKAAASEIPVIRGGVLLANDQMEFPRRPADKSAVRTSALPLAAWIHIVFIQLSLCSRWAWDAQMPWARSWKCKNDFWKVLTCGTFIIRLGSCSHAFCKDESRLLNFQQTEINVLELFLCLSNIQKPSSRNQPLLVRFSSQWD